MSVVWRFCLRLYQQRRCLLRHSHHWRNKKRKPLPSRRPRRKKRTAAVSRSTPNWSRSHDLDFKIDRARRDLSFGLLHPLTATSLFVVVYVGSIDCLDVFFPAEDASEMANCAVIPFECLRFAGRMGLHKEWWGWWDSFPPFLLRYGNTTTCAKTRMDIGCSAFSLYSLQSPYFFAVRYRNRHQTDTKFQDVTGVWRFKMVSWDLTS